MTYELDHAGFIIRDSKGLHIVVYGIQRGLGMEVFPVDLIYRPWKHAEGQVTDCYLELYCSGKQDDEKTRNAKYELISV